MKDENTNMSLNTKLSEALETLTLIILVYAIFLAILGIIIKNTELVVETCIMFVVCAIFQFLNYDVTTITSKGIKCSKYGSIEWTRVYRAKRKDNTIYIYTKEKENPYKIIINKEEDSQEISRIYKYILSKVKSPDKVK